jgi:ribose/xylose/arabinose/galactoside ABC-type transport system permease subunit
VRRYANVGIPLLAIFLLILINAFTIPDYLSIKVQDGRMFGSLVDVFVRSAPTLLIATGMTLVLATGGVDLSVGSVMAICGAVAASLIVRPENNLFHNAPEMSVLGIVSVAVVVGLLCGLFNGFLVSVVGLQPIVATLLLMVSGRGVAQLITDGSIITFSHPGFSAIGKGALATIPNPVLMAFIFLGIIAAFCRFTGYGLLLEAVGNNREAARYNGINVTAVILIAYLIVGIGASLAGMIATADINAADSGSAGMYIELDAILAVALGGTSLRGGKFSLSGTLLGAILMQLITSTIYARGVSADVTLIIKALIVITVCLAQSKGATMFAKRRSA